MNMVTTKLLLLLQIVISISSVASGDLVQFDFETGDMQGWKIVEGKFEKFICNRTVYHNYPNTPYNKQGVFFLSSLERNDNSPNDGFIGVAESPVFVLQSEEISFLVGGGSSEQTYVALCTIDGKEIRKAHGQDTEQMQLIQWHVPELVGNKVFMRLVDNNEGGWGHITFDNFSAQGKIDSTATKDYFANRKNVIDMSSFEWKSKPVSILESQIGYHPQDVKRVYLRSLQENPPVEYLAKEFIVIDDSSQKTVYTGSVKKWGQKWGSWWWILDFSPVRNEGEYFVKVGQLTSSVFKIRRQVLFDEDLLVVALTQLENRIDEGKNDKKVTIPGEYTKPGVKIYRDCGSHYAELPPVGVVVHALCDLHEKMQDKLSPENHQRLLKLLMMGADYYVAAQMKTDNPETNGRFYHSLLVNSQAPWAGNVHTYMDMAYAITVLTRAYNVVKDYDSQRANSYLQAAKLAWDCAGYRPYHLKEEWTLPKGCSGGEPFWGPQGFYNIFARCTYNIQDPNWTMPTTLRTRDRLPFIWGSTILYEITKEQKYIDKAIEFADIVASRQFTDWEKPIDGVFGTFYEFEERDDAFILEFSQGGHWWMGNIIGTHLNGFMNLLRLAPDNPRSATWYNVIKTYGENYIKKTAALSPFEIHPNSIYSDPKYGGVKFFQNSIIGHTCLYGLAARHIMEVGIFLNDSSYQNLANANVNFVAGLNPGIPNQYKETAWRAETLINGVGNRWFGGSHGLGAIPRGAVCNGFVASEQFWIYSGFQKYINQVEDGPRGIITPGGGYHFNEDWIAHSHAYVSGAIKLEAPFTLTLTTLDDGKPVTARVQVEVTDNASPHTRITRQFTTDAAGRLTATNIPTQTTGFIIATYKDLTINKKISPLNSANLELCIDFSKAIEVTIECPNIVPVGKTCTAKIKTANIGGKAVKDVLNLSASGITLDRNEIPFSLKPGETTTQNVSVEAGTKVMPYLILVRIPDSDRSAVGEGKVSSGKKN